MNINFKEIKEKYPRAFRKLEEYIKCYWDGYNFHIDMSKYANLGVNNPCYCDLENFFDENGIIITVEYDLMYRGRKKYYFRVYFDRRRMYQNGKDFFLTRQEAKEAAPIKAFEIMENKL